MTSPRKLNCLLPVLLVAFTSHSASAAPFIGTLETIAIDLAMDGADLATSTLVSGSDMLVSSSSGDLTAIPDGTGFGPLTLDLTDLLAAFTFAHASFGSFVPTSAVVTTQTASLLDVSFLGIFTPGAGLAGFDPTSVLIDVALSFSGAEGGVLDGTVRLTSTDAAVPEPGVAAMLALGAVALLRRRRV
jgi:hypothetical protein